MRFPGAGEQGVLSDSTILLHFNQHLSSEKPFSPFRSSQLGETDRVNPVLCGEAKCQGRTRQRGDNLGKGMTQKLVKF